MNLVDMRIVILSYSAGSAICTALIAFLWLQNRRHFEGPGLWLAAFIMQLAATVLIALRGVAPDFVSIVIANALLVLGTIFLYVGLERFVGKRGTQIHNASLLIIFVLVHVYFTTIQPNLAARNINISLAVLALCAQAAWLMLYRTDGAMRPSTRGAGTVFVAFCAISAVRILVNLAAPPENGFFRPDHIDTMLLLIYHIAFIALTFSLALMVNSRLVIDLERDVANRRQVENDLRKSEERFRSLVETSSDWIWEVNRQGVYTYASPKVADLLGYSPEEIIDKTPFDLIAPQEAGRLVPEIKRLMEQAKPLIAIENTSLHKNGQPVRLETSAVPILDTDGDLVGYRGIDRDITQSKRAEEALRHREETLKRSQEIAHLGSWELDLIDNRLTWSDEVYRIFGLKPQEFGATYEAFLDAVHPDDRAAVNDVYFGSLREGYDIYEIEHRIVRKATGEIRYVHEKCEHLRDKSGKMIRSIGMVHDITERRQTEEIVRLRLRLWEYAATHPVNELMQQALDEIEELTNSATGFYHFVEEDQNTLSLQAWSTRTQQEFCQAEGEGMHYNIDKAGVWVDCVHERKPIIHNDYAALPHRKGLPDGHAEVVRELVVPMIRDGRIVSILGVGNKPSDYEEKDIELVAYVTDVVWEIVERKRAEEALRKSNEELQARNEELDAFGHTVAHDLKGPLGNIIGFAYLLGDRETPLSGDEVYEMAKTIEQMGLKMDSIIDELMLLAGLRRTEVKMEPLNMARIIADVLGRASTLIEKSQAELACPANWPQAMGYAPWVEEVWTNYVNNAVKYGGSPPRIELGATQEDDTIRFWIRDNGPGLTPEEQRRLFTPFERLDQAHISGHGLGLSIVRRIVERMGGQATVESSGIAGEGSTFSFTLPAA